MRARFAVVAGLGLTLLSAEALGAEAPDPAVTAKNRQILAATPQAAGVFTVQDDGTFRHVQSGLICPAKYPNVAFEDLQIYPSSAGLGTDVGCDYRRPDDKGGAWAKLTIFVTKAAPDATADSAFEHYQKDLMQVMPDAQPLGAAFSQDPHDPDTSSPLATARTQEYRMTWNSQTYTSVLMVALKDGWTIEIRETYVGTPNAVDAAREGGGVNGAVLEMGDRLVSFRALMDALGTVGK